jgi:hypothetical protein
MYSANLAQFDLSEHNYESARVGLVAALEEARRLGSYGFEAETLRDLGYALLGLQRRLEARGAFSELLELATRDDSTASVQLLAGLAGITLTADPADPSAARLRGALDTLRKTTGISNDARNEQLDRQFERGLIDTFSTETWTREHTAGSALTLDQAIQLARSLALPAAARAASD